MCSLDYLLVLVMLLESSKGYGARGWLCAYGWVTIVILSMLK
jgi:hypothetical protein